MSSIIGIHMRSSWVTIIFPLTNPCLMILPINDMETDATDIKTHNMSRSMKLIAVYPFRLDNISLNATRPSCVYGLRAPYWLRLYSQSSQSYRGVDVYIFRKSPQMKYLMNLNITIPFFSCN